jgi:hypothetical protein
MLGGRFKATKVEADAAPQIKKTAGLTSLFHSRLAETPKKPEPQTPSEEPKKEGDDSAKS